MESWFSEAKSLESLDVDVCFCIQEELIEPLVRVPIPRRQESLVRSQDALGQEAALAIYYEDVVRLARKHGKSFNEVRQFFWLRLWLWNSAENIHLGFPWYDTVAEMSPLLKKISDTEGGEIFWDRDQSWEMQIHADSEFVHIREWDPDDEVVHAIVKVPRDALAAKCSQALERIEQVIRTLSAQLGVDVWTSYKDEAEFLPPPACPPKIPTKRR